MSENVHLFGPTKGAIKYQYTIPHRMAAKMMNRKSSILRRLISVPLVELYEEEYPIAPYLHTSLDGPRAGAPRFHKI